MSKELIISSNRHETRVAMIEEDEVVEVYHQRENEYSLAGSIHKGRVTRVLPGMQSAFVDIGLDRDAFLYVSDFFEDNEEYDKIVTSVEDKVFKQMDRPLPQSLVGTPPPPPLPAELPDSGEAAEAPVDVPTVDAAAAPATAVSSPLPDARRDDSRRDDRDRRGRRSRRRRGQKGGGRGLPDSKYYSPGPRGPAEGESMPREAPPEPAPRVIAQPEAVRTPESEADDFFVLPGESLAKYTGGPGEEEGPEVNESAGYDEPEAEAFPEDSAEPQPELAAAIGMAEAAAVEAAEPPVEEPVAAGQETISDIAAQPPAEPQPELAAAMEVAEEAAVEDRDPAESESSVEEFAAPEEPVETSEDVDVMPSDAAEPVEASETGEASQEAASSESGEAVSEEPIVEEEGPEPARIPTSLTATLREQGPRFMHRVSRRTRRRGRDGRGDTPQESGRGPQREPRPHEPGPRSAPEYRTSPPPAPKETAAARPEKSGSPSISDLLREGQEIIVQIAKEPLGQKGARITSHIALPGLHAYGGPYRRVAEDSER